MRTIEGLVKVGRNWEEIPGVKLNWLKSEGKWLKELKVWKESEEFREILRKKGLF